MFGKPTADPKSVASIILGGGNGSQLFPLTVSLIQGPLQQWKYLKSNDFGLEIHPSAVKEHNVQILDAIISIVGVLDYGSELKNTMMMGADIYETEAEIASLLADRNCIIDMNARIGNKMFQ